MVELFTYSRDSDQNPCSAVSDLGLHCLPVSLGVSSFQWVKNILSFLYIHPKQMLYIPSLLQLCLSVCVKVLWPSQPNGVSTVSLPNHTFTGQA